MTDPVPSNQEVPDEQVVSFGWWVCMLPFFAFGAFFVWRWLQNRVETHFLLYALGVVIIGLVITAVGAGMGSGDDTKSVSTNSDTNKTS